MPTAPHTRSPTPLTGIVPMPPWPQGHALLPNVVCASELAVLRAQATRLAIDPAAARNCLDQAWCTALARQLLTHPAIVAIAGPDAVAVQCTLFDKSPARNWLVAWHQDLSLPMAQRVEAPGWHGWSIKHGVHFAQPPATDLARVLAVRLHLDDCGPNDGALRVSPATHTLGVLTGDALTAARQHHGAHLCTALAGDALLLRPLLLHASSKSSSGRQRRVLHLVLAPRDLPPGLQWRWSVGA